MIDVIAELALVRDSLAKRKLGINYAIQEEGKYLLGQGFTPNRIPDEDLPDYGIETIAGYFLLVQIVEADVNRPIAEVLAQHETWVVLANKVLAKHDELALLR